MAYRARADDSCVNRASTAPAVTRGRVHAGRNQEADVVVVPQRVHRHPAEPPEAPDGHQLVGSHDLHRGRSGNPKVKTLRRRRGIHGGPQDAPRRHRCPGLLQ
jgi:hypothetical protein